MELVMYTATYPLTEKDRVIFDEHGFLYIKGYYSKLDLNPLLLDIYKVIGLLLRREGLYFKQLPSSFDNFDSGITELIQKDRKLGGVVYEAVKKLPSHLVLATDPRNVEISKFLLCSDFVGFASRGWGLRLDHPNEDTFITQLHQEFVSQICSPQGLVYWSPLRNVDMETGPVIMYPKSHQNGVFSFLVLGAGSYGLKIKDEKVIEQKYEPVCPEVDIGDCVVMDFLTLHKSSPNRSVKTRWALLSRYFNFENSVGNEIGWVGGIQEGNTFDKVFPSLVHQNIKGN